MRVPLVPVIILLVMSALIDAYIYVALQRLTTRRLWPDIQLYSAIAFMVAIIVVVALPKKSMGDGEFMSLMWVIFAYCSVYIPKLLFVVVDLGASLPLLWGGNRLGWLEATGGILAALTFLLLWWGALINRYRVDVRRVDVPVASLPRAFEGMTIAQISDLHVGSFARDTMFVHKLVDSINALQPDLIVFTGDIVNRRSAELEPFAPTLARLKAKYGVYSILGNHDYGDYSSWPSKTAKRKNLSHLINLQRQMGWTMLNNSTAWLHAGEDSIALIGVENVGDPPFRTYGDLRRAYPEIADLNTKILLSHNPAHWVADLKDNPASNIALTLAGHTHAMQVELFGISPARFRYPTWGGMYTDGQGQRMYVNIGCGEVGFPARIGATPEVTFFTLTKGE